MSIMHHGWLYVLAKCHQVVMPSRIKDSGSFEYLFYFNGIYKGHHIKKIYLIGKECLGIQKGQYYFLKAKEKEALSVEKMLILQTEKKWIRAMENSYFEF